MCGIFGFVDAQRVTSEEDLVRLTDLIDYRGPDDAGYEFTALEEFNLGLGHRRLSILDLSARGHQPMHFEHLTTVYNGEIYNFKEVRAELEQVGCDFNTTSDTEVLLKAIHKWGLQDAVNKFNGMFAIALFDRKEQSLYLVRDRIGVKPLYFYTDESTLVFSSELKPIIQYPGFKKEIDSHALNMFLFHGYITSPRSIFKDVHKLEPGSWLKYKNGRIEQKAYWALSDKFAERKVKNGLSEEDAIEEVDEILTKAIGYRMISDVPIGSFLSGGYDSSIVSAIMQKQSETPIKTFTIGFHEHEYNEADDAKRIADYLKTDHYEKYLSIDDAKELIVTIPDHYDEPFADSSQLPMLLLSKFAKEHVSVVLSGDGGDEIYCGYQSYANLLNRKKFENISKVLNYSPLKLAPGILSKFGRKYLKLLYLNDQQSIINSEYKNATYYLNGLTKTNGYKLDSKYFEKSVMSDNIQEANMLLDMITYLPDDIMAKVDRATMSVSLEAREPLLDFRFLENSLTHPHSLKYKNGSKKYLLKQLAHKYIPSELLDRPKKGFSIPIYHWLKGDLSFLCDKYLALSFIEDQGIFDYKKINDIRSRFLNEPPSEQFFARMIWNIIVFQMWWEKYM